MRQPECVPEHYVRVVETALRVGGYPGWDALGRLAGGLRDVAACRVELAVGICGRISESALHAKGGCMIATHIS
jgi:hypothetical protein